EPPLVITNELFTTRLQTARLLARFPAFRLDGSDEEMLRGLAGTRECTIAIPSNAASYDRAVQAGASPKRFTLLAGVLETVCQMAIQQNPALAPPAFVAAQGLLTVQQRFRPDR